MAARRRYTDTDLAAAVAAARSWRGVLRHLGLVATSAAAIRSVRQHADRLGLDHSHFTGQRRWSDEQLAEAVRSAGSWAQVCRSLGLVGGSSETTVRGHAVRLGLDTSHLQPAPTGPPPDPAASGFDLRNLPRAGSLLAAGWFTLCGHDVSWPLEPCRYDLLVRFDGVIERIQVKTTTVRKGRSWVVSISTTRKARTPYAPGEVDRFFVIDGDQSYYLIPFKEVGGRHMLSLSAYAAFRVRDGCGGH